MAGACKVLQEAGCALVGGHTAEGAELCLGFTVNVRFMLARLFLCTIITVVVCRLSFDRVLRQKNGYYTKEECALVTKSLSPRPLALEPCLQLTCEASFMVRTSKMR